MRSTDAVVVGSGHAGLSLSRALTNRGIEHEVLERDTVASTWRNRWESFCLVTPNLLLELTDQRYDGDDPEGFLLRDEIVAFLERYAEGAPVRTGVAVSGIDKDGDGFLLQTSDGPVTAKTVIAASGAFQRPFVPDALASLRDTLDVRHVDTYRSPAELPGGGVLIIGSGQTGAQLAEELHDAGRDVVIACGKAPTAVRRFGGHDMLWWLREIGFHDQTLEAAGGPPARLGANPIATGHGGGHDLGYRTLQASGVELVGHFEGADATEIRFADDLAASVAWGDERFQMMMGAIGKLIADRGLDVEVPTLEPFICDPATSVRADRFTTVLCTGGFRPDYGSWIPWADAFDDVGFPIQTDGESPVVEGLFFMGVHFLRKRKSSTLWGAGEDARVVAGRVAARLGASAS
jgi:putative flavoprotein involved in K+ transport